MENRCQGLSPKSIDWLDRAAKQLWDHTQGLVNDVSLSKYRNYILNLYKSHDSHVKALGFAISFLNHLGRVSMNPKYSAYSVFLELPKTKKTRKCVTSRIVTIDDIITMIGRINEAERTEEISSDRAIQYRAVIQLGAYTGQRSEATLSKITVGEVRRALDTDRPCITIPSEKDKIRMAHYVPIHPQLIEPLKGLIGGREDDELLFSYHSINMWLKHKKFPLSRCQHHFILGDLRKFAEQHGDAICWNDSNRSYILTHGVSGVQWAHYKSPLPEYVYDVYMQAWKEVTITLDEEK